MSKEILEVRQYNSINDPAPYIVYTVRDGDKYVLCNGGSVFFTDKEHCEDMIRDGEKLEVPHSDSKELDVFLVNGIIGVYDWNMNCLSTWDNLDELVEAYREDEDRFTNFLFPKEEEYGNDDDYSGDYDIPDFGPSYYDPRYDGPFHYIPPGER